MNTENSGWIRKEFYDWAFKKCFDGLLAGGTKGLKDALTYEVLQEIQRIMKHGGFKGE